MMPGRNENIEVPADLPPVGRILGPAHQKALKQPEGRRPHPTSGSGNLCESRNISIFRVAHDLFGASGRRMLPALVKGVWRGELDADYAHCEQLGERRLRHNLESRSAR